MRRPQPLRPASVGPRCRSGKHRPLIALSAAVVVAGYAGPRVAEAARDKTVDPAIAALVRASEPIVADPVRHGDNRGRQTIDDCRRPRRGQPFRVDLRNQSAVERGKAPDRPRFSVFRTIYLAMANRSGFVTVALDIPLLGIHMSTRFFLRACVTPPQSVTFSYHQDRSPGNVQPPLRIRESVRGPGLQIMTVRRDNGELGAVRRIHALTAVPLPAS